MKIFLFSEHSIGSLTMIIDLVHFGLTARKKQFGLFLVKTLLNLSCAHNVCRWYVCAYSYYSYNVLKCKKATVLNLKL